MPEGYDVTLDGRVCRVELDAEGPDGLLRVRVDGREKLIDARALGGGAWSLLERAPSAPPPAPPGEGPGATATAAAAAPGAGLAVARARLVRVDGALAKLTVQVGHPDGEPRTVVLTVVPARGTTDGPVTTSSERDEAAPVTVRAPIPGKIVKLAVRVGERVASGQAMVVLEAMKMENEIRSPRDGEVKAILVREGASVESGQELVTVGS
jgi:biotin carboxyl carrier protein